MFFNSNISIEALFLVANPNKYLDSFIQYSIWSPYDIILIPSILFLILTFSVLFKRYKVTNGALEYTFYSKFIFLKLFFGFMMALIYVYIYGYGDSFAYWNDGCDIGRVLYQNPQYLFFIFKSDAHTLNNTIMGGTLHPIMNINENLFMAKLIGIFLPLADYSYITGTIIVAFISSFGNWKLFQAFRLNYSENRLLKPIFYFTLIIPSCLLWGSGLLKDTITYSAIGWLTYVLMQLLIKNKIKISYILILIFCSVLLFNLKKYILFAFIPAFILFYIKSKLYNINKYLRKILYFLVLMGIVFGLFIFKSQINEMMGQFAIDKIIETAGSLNYNLSNIEAGSSFSLGIPLSTSPSGMVAIFPFAVVATLFRPFLWEVHNVVSLASALESLFFLVFTIYVIRKVTFRKFLSNISNDGMVQFCLVYAIFFSYAVGFSTSNFGSLVRYKIPMMPFYLMGLFVIYYNEVIKKGKPSKLIEFINGKKTK